MSISDRFIAISREVAAPMLAIKAAHEHSPVTAKPKTAERAAQYMLATAMVEGLDLDDQNTFDNRVNALLDVYPEHTTKVTSTVEFVEWLQPDVTAIRLGHAILDTIIQTPPGQDNN
jgi:hypothetical protein